MDRSLAAYLLGLSTLGGLLVLPAIPGYLPLAIVSLLTGWVAYGALRLARSRQLFLALMAVNLAAGIGLRWVPHEGSGALGSLGLALAAIVLVPSLFLLMRIRGREVSSSTGHLPGGHA
jgi:hypothetical protein